MKLPHFSPAKNSVPKSPLKEIKGMVEEVDPVAFLAAGGITEMRGGRFKKRDIH